MVDPQPAGSSSDVLGDILSPLAIEGPPGQPEHGLVSGLGGAPNAEDALAIEPVVEQTNSVQVLPSIALIYNKIWS